MNHLEFLAAAYFVAWLVFFLYQVSLDRRQKEVQKELQRLLK